MSEPAVSVLIAARDAAETLPAALRSVQRQRFPDWECVVVDDGSRDATRELAASFAGRDPRFRVLARPAAGVVAARNAGLDLCRGASIALLDADDLMHSRRLERQWAALRADPSLDGVGCQVRYFPRRAVGEGRAAYERWLNAFGGAGVEAVAQARFIEMPIGHPTLLLRAEWLQGHRYRDRGWPEDWDLLLRLLGAGARLAVLPERLHAWRLRPESLSQRSPAYTIEGFLRCRAAFLAEQVLAGTERYLLWGYGGTGKALRAALLEHGKRPSHVIELHPGRIGNRIHGAPVVAPSELPRLRERGELNDKPVLVSVAGAQARRLIGQAMAEFGLRPGADFFFTA